MLKMALKGKKSPANIIPEAKFKLNRKGKK